MSKRLPTIAAALALSVAVTAAACSSKTQEVPAPTPANPAAPGAITGTVQPANAILDAQLVSNSTQQNVAGTLVNSQTGAYRFDAVAPGSYILFFNSKPGYVRPRQQPVVVAASKTTVVPSVLVVQSTAEITVNENTFSPPYISLSLGFDGKTLPSLGYFSIVMGDGPDFSAASGSYIFFLTLPYTIQPGSYPLNTASAYAIFTETKADTFDSRFSPSAGSLTITAVENTAPFPRSVSGNFSFVGNDATLGTQKIISGTFTNAYF